LQHTYYNLVVTKNGEPVSVLRAISDPGPVSDADWIEVVPGGTRTFLLTSFPDAFDQLRPGAYEAHVEFWRDPFQSGTTKYASGKATFPTNRGTCFRSKANPNALKTFDSCTLRVQSGPNGDPVHFNE